jgi:hypothetical protein
MHAWLLVLYHFRLNTVAKFSSDVSENSLRVSYKDGLVNSLRRNRWFMLRIIRSLCGQNVEFVKQNDKLSFPCAVKDMSEFHRKIKYK